MKPTIGAYELGMSSALYATQHLLRRALLQPEPCLALFNDLEEAGLLDTVVTLQSLCAASQLYFQSWIATCGLRIDQELTKQADESQITALQPTDAFTTLMGGLAEVAASLLPAQLVPTSEIEELIQKLKAIGNDFVPENEALIQEQTGYNFRGLMALAGLDNLHLQAYTEGKLTFNTLLIEQPEVIVFGPLSIYNRLNA
jgi:hypothetical protein